MGIAYSGDGRPKPYRVMVPTAKGKRDYIGSYETEEEADKVFEKHSKKAYVREKPGPKKKPLKTREFYAQARGGIAGANDLLQRAW